VKNESFFPLFLIAAFALYFATNASFSY